MEPNTLKYPLFQETKESRRVTSMATLDKREMGEVGLGDWGKVTRAEFLAPKKKKKKRKKEKKKKKKKKQSAMRHEPSLGAGKANPELHKE